MDLFSNIEGDHPSYILNAYYTHGLMNTIHMFYFMHILRALSEFYANIFFNYTYDVQIKCIKYKNYSKY